MYILLYILSFFIILGSFPSLAESHRSLIGRSSVSALWRRVMIAPSSHQDLLKIVNKWYPELESLAAQLIGTIDLMVLHRFSTSRMSNSVGTFCRNIL